MSEEVEEVGAKRKRRSLLEQAVVGDLVVAIDRAAGTDATVITVIEQVFDGSDAPAIVQRWRDQGIIGAAVKPQVWQCMAGGYYRLRRSR